MELRVKIDDYSSWVTGELDRVLRPTRTKASKLVDEAARSLNDSRSFYDSLARKGERDMASKKDAASYRAARVIGHAAQQAESGLRDIQVPKEVSWESLKVLKDGLSSASRSIRSLRDGAARELSGFYLLDQRAFGGALERVARSGERLSAFLDGEGAYLQRARTVSGIVESIAAVRRDLAEKLDEATRIGKERERLLASLEEMNVQLDTLVSKDDLREVLEIEKELRKESRAFRAETLAHLQRPLRRLGDLSQRGDYPIGSEEREALAMFVKSPYKSLLSNSNGKYLAPILIDLKKAIDSGKMEFKPKKTSRVSSQLDQLINSRHLPDKQEKGRRLLRRRRELLSVPDCKDRYQRRKNLLLKIEEAHRQGEEMSERSRSVQSMSDALNKRLGELLRLAETKTREYVGREIQLESPSKQ